MITEKQHKQICQKISELRTLGIPVYTYAGDKVIGVDLQTGALMLNNNTKLTHMSYKPGTNLKTAWRKFEIHHISLYDVKRMRVVHGSVKKRQPAEFKWGVTGE